MEEVKNFKRQQLFDHYNSCENPNLIVTIEFDVTKVVEYCKMYKYFYATFGYLITKTVNDISEFKYRYIDGKIYYFDRVKSNYTQMKENETIGFYSIPDIENYDEYIKKYREIELDFKNGKENGLDIIQDEVWFSCLPWFSFNSLVTPIRKDITIPQFVWGKYEQRKGKYYMNLMIMAHHGFVDGYHIGKFVDKLNENIKSFNGK